MGRALVALLAFALAGAAAATPAIGPTLSFDAGTSTSLIPDKDGGLQAILPVTLSSKKAIVQPVLVSVVAKGNFAEQLLGRIKPHLTRIDGNDTAGLLTLTIGRADLAQVPPGTYTLLLSLPGHAAVKGKPLSVSVTRAAPKVSSPLKIVVKEIRPLLFGETEASRGELRVEEDSNNSPLENGRLDDYHEQAAGEADNGHLVFRKPTLAIGAGAAVSAPVSTNGGFPLGNTAGRVVLSSPELEAPLTIPFEVQVRRHPLWLIACAGLGSVLGFVVRTLLANRRQRSAARVEAEDTLRECERALDRIADPTFQAAVAEAGDKINAALTKGDAKEISETAAAARKTATDAEADLVVRIKVVADALVEPESLLAADWTLPATESAQLSSMRHDVQAIKASLVSRNAKQAQAGLDELQNVAGPKLQRQLSDYATALKSLLDTMAAGPFPKEFATEIRDTSTTLAAELQKAAGGPAAPFDSLKTALTSVDKAYRHAAELGDAAPTQAEALMANLVTMEPAPIHGKTEFTAMQGATRAFAGGLREQLESARAARLALPLALEQVRRRWSTWIRAIAPKADVAKLEQQLQQAAWQQALHDALASEIAQHVVTGSAPKPQIVALLASGTPHFQRGQVSPPPLAAANPGPVAVSLHATLLRVAGERSRLETVTFIQTFVIGLVFLAGLFATKYSTWIGNPEQMFEIFILAFGVDLSSEGILSILRPKA